MNTQRPGDTERQMAACLQAGDRAGFDTLYDTYSPMLMGFIANTPGKDGRDAKDVLKETFVYLWKNRKDYRAGSERVFTWMIRSARKVMRVQENAGAFPKAEIPVPVSEAAPSGGNLSDTVFRSLYFEGRAVTEVTRQFNLTENEVKQLLRNRIRQLKPQASL